MVLNWYFKNSCLLTLKTTYHNNSRNSALCTFYVIKGTTKSYLDTDWSNLSEVFCFIWHCTTFLLRIYKNGISNISTFHKIIVHIMFSFIRGGEIEQNLLVQSCPIWLLIPFWLVVWSVWAGPWWRIQPTTGSISAEVSLTEKSLGQRQLYNQF